MTCNGDDPAATRCVVSVVQHIACQRTATQMNQYSGTQRKKVTASLRQIFVGDALSMPVHWYYRRADIMRAFPPNGVEKFEAAPKMHPSSIMSLHSTSRGGRGTQSENTAIVGNVILKGKAKYWGQSAMHYHQGMPAGENTLNAWCARLMLNWVVQQDLQSLEVIDWLKQYEQFMTAEPPQHPDTYAESYHREFFANRALGKALTDCGGHTHDTPSMGALVTMLPFAMALLSEHPIPVVQEKCRELVYATHPDDLLMDVVNACVQLMAQLLTAGPEDVTELCCAAAEVVPGGNIRRYFPVMVAGEQKILSLVAEDSAVIGNRYSPACYITDSWPGVCYLVAKYHRMPEAGLLVNTNLGGENAHRGSVLGCLLGLVSGESVGLYAQLKNYTALNTEIECWCDRFCI